MSDMYRVVTSTKPQRQGEAFILRNNKFFLKVYRDVPCGAEYFARNLCRLLNRHDPLTANPAAATGVSPEMAREALAHLPFDVRGPSRFEWLSDYFNNAMANPNVPCECCGVSPDGTIHHEQDPNS